MNEYRFGQFNYFHGFIFAFIALLVALTLLAPADKTELNYEMQANCIAEYDYHHPNVPQMDNLVAALKVCR